MPVMAETISRSKRLCAMFSMKEPSILMAVDGKAPQIFERAHAGAEIVEADAAAPLARLAHELFGGVEIGDRGGLGDLEADARMRRPGLGDDGVDEVPQ